MEYTKQQKRAMVQALEKAKKYLAVSADDDGRKSSYICCALPQNKGGDLVRKVINERLEQQPTVRSWLDIHGYLRSDYYRLSERAKYAQHQAYRHRWIDALIEEFSK